MSRVSRFDRIMLAIAGVAFVVRVAYAIWSRDFAVQATRSRSTSSQRG